MAVAPQNAIAFSFLSHSIPTPAALPAHPLKYCDGSCCGGGSDGGSRVVVGCVD